MLRRQLEVAVAGALRFLAGRQESNGSWQDYRLPVGASGEWVTAFVGFACATASRHVHGSEAASGIASACRALDWLITCRAYDAGWGFNASTGPDADSTAWAMRLHHELDEPLRAADIDFLCSHWHAGRGFSTFRRTDAWGQPHPDVTPVAALALPVDIREPRPADILHAVFASRSPDGTWPSYWWRSSHYSTAANGELLASRGLGHLCGFAVDDGPGALRSHFDTACALMAGCFTLVDDSIVDVLSNGLVGAQKSDGSWEGSDDLRVTDPLCRAPWLAPAGRRYRDIHALITTATSLRALTLRLSKRPATARSH